MSKIRKFEVVENWARKNEGVEIKLPKRATKFSTGYDFFVPTDTILIPNKPTFIHTDVKAHIPDDEFLSIYIRSSLAVKKEIVLINGVGIVDADYSRNNNKNDGNIMICLMNTNKKYITLNQGERVAQGIFQKYYIVEDDEVEKIRNGGVGSTG